MGSNGWQYLTQLIHPNLLTHDPLIDPMTRRQLCEQFIPIYTCMNWDEFYSADRIIIISVMQYLFL